MLISFTLITPSIFLQDLLVPLTQLYLMGHEAGQGSVGGGPGGVLHASLSGCPRVSKRVFPLSCLLPIFLLITEPDHQPQTVTAPAVREKSGAWVEGTGGNSNSPGGAPSPTPGSAPLLTHTNTEAGGGFVKLGLCLLLHPPDLSPPLTQRGPLQAPLSSGFYVGLANMDPYKRPEGGSKMRNFCTWFLLLVQRVSLFSG